MWKAFSNRSYWRDLTLRSSKLQEAGGADALRQETPHLVRGTADDASRFETSQFNSFPLNPETDLVTRLNVEASCHLRADDDLWILSLDS